MQDGRQHHDEFEHPCRQAPELRKKSEDRMLLGFGDFVVAMLLTSCIYFDAAKPGVGIDAECPECV